MNSTSKPRGRPPMPYDPDVALDVLMGLMEGKTLTEVCEDPDLPSERTVYRWLATNSTFSQAYMRAREVQMMVWADQIVLIADDAQNDYMDRLMADGGTERVVDMENINRSRLRIDTRKFLMAKIAPKVFGDKVQVEHSGSIATETMTDEELVAKARAAVESVGGSLPDDVLLGFRGQEKARRDEPAGE